MQPAANRALSEWNLDKYSSVVGDNENHIVQYCKDTFLPDLYITDCSAKSNPHGMNATDYLHGAVQPAVLVFVGDKPAMAWACQPSVSNLQGSLGRPEPTEVWQVVEDCLQNWKKGIEFQCSNGEDLGQTGGCQAILWHKTCCSIS
mmetsp:Transcript_10009/g.16627  ORF Transcript_10009/g.16627 Transcript_10009/m.16627 type:complete len:146 (-) Transcript_10009:782-1219(-)